MKLKDKISEKAGVLYAAMYPIVGNHEGTVKALLIGLNSERDTIIRIKAKPTVDKNSKLTIATEIDKIDQLISKINNI